MIKNEQIEIDENGDIFANDLLGREEVIKDLSELIINTTQSFVFCINADWGAGKTTFVELWKAHLKKVQGIDSIYFSAWKDDFSQDPLVSILAELDTYINKNQKGLKTEFKKIKKESIKIIKPILSQMIDKATGGIIEAGLIKELIKKPANYYDDFKKSLKVLSKINGNKPFIIFIDELDRCRPLYAIELLERIKHIFDIEKLIFVLAIDKENLTKSIKSQYGDIDADNYLRRFIDFEYPLKNPSVDKFCAVLYQRFGLEQILQTKGINPHPVFLVEIQCLSQSFNFSLRKIEQIFTKLQIIFKTIELGFESEFLIRLIFFECLKTFDDQQYYQLLDSAILVEDIERIKKIALKGFNQVNDEWLKARIANIIDTTPYRASDYKKYRKLHDKLMGEYQVSKTEYLSHRIYMLEHMLSKKLTGHYNSLINRAIQKINWLDKFNFDTHSENTQ